MPRISLWKEGAHTNDYRFFDGRIREMFTLGGTTVNVHKYIGTTSDAGLNDATQPAYATVSEQNIQDLLFLENRDRKYDTSVYNIRGVYNTGDIDFDLSQFGLFLQNDTLFITFHLNDMVETMGRKIIAGDVLELPHLMDFYPLDANIAPLRRYYVVQDAARASEGYSPTWWPHLWRAKCIPLVDGQEYRDILKQDAGAGDGSTLQDFLSTYNKEIAINNAVVNQAIAEVAKAGYDTTGLYTVPTNSDGSAKFTEVPTADNVVLSADSEKWLANSENISPTKSGYSGYLLGDVYAPNGFPVASGISFPAYSAEGEFFLRLDFLPNRLFRFDGKKWAKVQDVVRNSPLPAFSTNQKSTFINNNKTRILSDGTTITEKQTLSQALKAQVD
jgi:hypothetical protein